MNYFDSLAKWPEISTKYTATVLLFDGKQQQKAAKKKKKMCSTGHKIGS